MQTLESGAVKEETKNLIYATEFYQAALVICNYTQDHWLGALSSWLSPSEYNMWISTQVAIWQLLHDNCVPNNNFDSVDAYPLAKKLLEFANAATPAILTEEPAEGILMQGEAKFTQMEQNGKWVSSAIKIVPPSNYATTYKLHLPDGVQCVGGDPNKIKAGEPFQLFSTEKLDENKSIKITAEVYWTSEIYHFEPTGINSSQYQNMAGAYRMKAPLQLTLPIEWGEEF